MRRRKQVSSEVRRHWSRVAGLGCIISGSPNPTIHHCHGGSMRRYVHAGMGQKTSDWLVIPLTGHLHVGSYGIDAGMMSVIEWEEHFGLQVDMLDEVCRRLGENVWKRAGIDRTVEGLGNGASGPVMYRLHDGYDVI